MIINNVELEFDIFDADVAKCYETSLDKVMATAKKQNNAKISEVIETQCHAVFDFFDEVFGEGTSNEVFGDKVNLMTCLKAFECVIEEVDRQTKEAESLTSKYTQNRAQRRTKR